MKALYLKAFFYTPLICLLCSCNKREAASLQPTIYEGVTPELWYFFLKFEVEAKKRGQVIDLRILNIKGKIEKIHATGIVGLCSHSATRDKEVIIDENFWNRSSDYEREAIIFHELGHCALERGHEDATLDNGMCKSLMRSGFSPCLTFYRKGSQQDYYLDELFSN